MPTETLDPTTTETAPTPDVEAAAPVVADAAPTDATPAPEGDAAATPPAAAATPDAPSDAPAAPEPEAPPPEPVIVNADRRPYLIEGATKAPDGTIQFTPEAWSKYQGVVSQGLRYEQAYRQLQQREHAAKRAQQDAEQAGAEESARAAALADGLAALIQNDTNLAAYLGPQVQALINAADRAALDKRRELMDLRSRPDPEQVAAEQRARVEQALEDELMSAALPAYPDLNADPRVRAEVIGFLRQHADKYVTLDAKGQASINVPFLDAQLGLMARARQQAQVQAQQTATATAARRANAAVAAAAPAKAPSVAKATAATLAPADDTPPDDPTERIEWINERIRRGQSIPQYRKKR